ncbi:MAG: DmsC/YnfH family molybdoenzyme membrane anchor subunit [Halofilum sp. (in: g-proteobacteria)]|nr:DmsC/YnfH family molybdoenzyme membrane anchor subunit [Halofilum sp. (in: g-proteobacteria)]
MKPTLSIILFTVSSGAGLGLVMLLVVLQAFGLGAPLPLPARLGAWLLGLALVVGGLVASTFHLANPRNAWKAFNRFRTSWLSREGVFSVALLAMAALHVGALWLAGGDAPGLPVLATLVLVLALATLYSTAMIYASLKPIRQWHNPVVPPMYLLMGLATGGVLLSAVEGLAGELGGVTAGATLGLLVAAALVKGVYYGWIARPAGPTINTATGMTRAQVRLLDSGHSHGTFLTHEFGNQLRRLPPWLLRAAGVRARLRPAGARGRGAAARRAGRLGRARRRGRAGGHRGRALALLRRGQARGQPLPRCPAHLSTGPARRLTSRSAGPRAAAAAPGRTP